MGRAGNVLGYTAKNYAEYMFLHPRSRSTRAASRPNRLAIVAASALVVGLVASCTGGQTPAPTGSAESNTQQPGTPNPQETQDATAGEQEAGGAEQTAQTAPPFEPVAQVDLTDMTEVAAGLTGASLVTALPHGEFLITQGSLGKFLWVDAASKVVEVGGPGAAAILEEVTVTPDVNQDSQQQIPTPGSTESAPGDSDPQGDPESEGDASGPQPQVAYSAPAAPGVFGVALSPGFEADRLLYMFVSTGVQSRVVTVKWHAGTLEEPTEILAGLPAGAGRNGGALGFGPDGNLFVAVGDGGEPARAQDLENLAGKILRVFPDGTVPGNNPLTHSPVWSLGHRNVTSMAWTPQGVMYAVEPGQDSGDELNLILPGANYGWPRTEGGTAGPGLVDPEGLTAPVLTWQFSPQGYTFGDPVGLVATGEGLYVAAFHGQRIWRLGLTDLGLGKAQEFETRTLGPIAGIALAVPGEATSSMGNTGSLENPGQLEPATLVVLTGYTVGNLGGVSLPLPAGVLQQPLGPMPESSSESSSESSPEPGSEPGTQAGPEPGSDLGTEGFDPHQNEDQEAGTAPAPAPPMPTSDRLISFKVTY